MKTKLLIEIECDKKLCGDCPVIRVDDYANREYCGLYGYVTRVDGDGNLVRCQQCLDAERRAKKAE